MSATIGISLVEVYESRHFKIESVCRKRVHVCSQSIQVMYRACVTTPRCTLKNCTFDLL